MNVTLEINMDQACRICGRPGACQNGLCIKCTADMIIKKGRKNERNMRPISGADNQAGRR
jgi:hypothetical protein